jgi:hypothetical protein
MPVTEPTPQTWLHGVDFTSAPRRAKGITIASGTLQGDTLLLHSLSTLHDFARFADWLQQPGPWLAAFDFPFSFPRELIVQLDWPQTWPELIRHIATLERSELRTRFQAICDARPVGKKFIHRAGDQAAGSSSSMKWVNPPVAYMLHAGAPQLLAAQVTIPGMLVGDPQRIALEAYPGLVARSITRASYKNDSKAKQTPEREATRSLILQSIESGAYPLGIRLDAGPYRAELIMDASGDLLDAVLCTLQAAWAWQRRDAGYGLPPHDPLEGWIIGAENPPL